MLGNQKRTQIIKHFNCHSSFIFSFNEPILVFYINIDKDIKGYLGLEER